MPKITAFIARSFLQADEQRLSPLLAFLKTFESLGFFCKSAEPAEVQSVSVKVQRIIDECNVMIGIFTRRHPVCKIDNSSQARFRLFCKTNPEVWTAPAWVLQESGYALGKNKKLILLREPDVEVPGLQGDLEYIPFTPEHASEVFSKLNQMIHGIVAEAAGTKVELMVTTGEVQPVAELPAPIGATKPAESDAPALWLTYGEMLDAAKEKDFEKLLEAYKRGTEIIAKGEGEDLDELMWDCYYHSTTVS